MRFFDISGKKAAGSGGTDPESVRLNEMRGQIRKWERQITELAGQIEKEQRTGICTRCGSQIPDGAKYCIVCGTAVPENVTRWIIEDDGYVQCPSCGARVQKLNYCTECGQALTKGRSAGTVSKPAPLYADRHPDPVSKPTDRFWKTPEL